MPKINNHIPELSSEMIDKRLASAADLAGNIDGVATKEELSALLLKTTNKQDPQFDLQAAERQGRLDELLGKDDNNGIQTMSTELQALPSSLNFILSREIDKVSLFIKSKIESAI